MTRELASDADIEGATDRDADGDVRQERSGADNPERQIANALTAILLHAEAIRRRSAGMGSEEAEIVSSTRHIISSAKHAWTALDETLQDRIHREPPP